MAPTNNPTIQPKLHEFMSLFDNADTQDIIIIDIADNSQVFLGDYGQLTGAGFNTWRKHSIVKSAKFLGNHNKTMLLHCELKW